MPACVEVRFRTGPIDEEELLDEVALLDEAARGHTTLILHVTCKDVDVIDVVVTVFTNQVIK